MSCNCYDYQFCEECSNIKFTGVNYLEELWTAIIIETEKIKKVIRDGGYG